MVAAQRESRSLRSGSGTWVWKGFLFPLLKDPWGSLAFQEPTGLGGVTLAEDGRGRGKPEKCQNFCRKAKGVPLSSRARPWTAKAVLAGVGT